MVFKTGEFLAETLGPSDADFDLLQDSPQLYVKTQQQPAPVSIIVLEPSVHKNLTELKDWSDMPVNDSMQSRASCKFVAAVIVLLLGVLVFFFIMWYLLWHADEMND